MQTLLLPHPPPFLHPIITLPHPLPLNPHFHATFRYKPVTNLLHSSHLTPASTSSTTPSPQEDDDNFRILTATRTEYNNIIILETDNSRVLLLDDTCNVHSILYTGEVWTNSYWDHFISLPAIIPDGNPVAVYGLGGGTIARQLLNFWPTLRVHGWELDEVLVDRARQFFGLSELETENDFGGAVSVHVGDALSAQACVEGGYAGIVVDLFSNGKVLPELEKAETWLEMESKLIPGGRIMVNCGGDIPSSSVESGWECNLTIQAMCEAFGRSSVHWKKMPENESGNYLAFTGDLPDIGVWSDNVPEKLVEGVSLWRTCQSS